jgi:hypothetical protein
MPVTVSGARTVRRGRRLAEVPTRRRRMMAVLAAATAVACVGLLTGARAPAAARVHWGKAEPVPGLEALNKGYDASVTAISCWGAGGCAVGGFFTDRDHHSQAFVARERKGRWGKAEEVPGTAALKKGGSARVSSVSCARTSVCVAVGTYTDKAGNEQWFTVTERDGRWATAARVPDPALNEAAISTVSCAASGLCAAGGSFTDTSTGPEAWVTTEVRGHWQRAMEVPGIAALNLGPDVSLDSVSCASAGNCAAGGQYSACATCITDNGYPPVQPYVVTEANGKWGTAEEVTGIGALLHGGADADTTFMACPSAGNCTAAGYYQPDDVETCDFPPLVRSAPATEPPPPDGCSEVFEVSERHGTWAGATRTSASTSYVGSLTCPAAGDCMAAGIYETGPETSFGMVRSETNDQWARSLKLTGTQQVNSVSCASAGYCAAGGTNDGNSALVISQWHGVWGKAVTPPGLPAQYNPNQPGGAVVNAVACPPRITLCVAGGSQTPANSLRTQAFIASQAG